MFEYMEMFYIPQRRHGDVVEISQFTDKRRLTVLIESVCLSQGGLTPCAFGTTTERQSGMLEVAHTSRPEASRVSFNRVTHERIPGKTQGHPTVTPPRNRGEGA